MTIIAERWEKIQALSLKYGAHQPDSTFCVMEAAAYVAGEPWNDHPKCVPRTIAAILRRWNDRLPTDADRDRLLKPFIPRIIGLPLNKEIEIKRAILVGDWGLRVLIPECLRLAKKAELADQLAAASESKTQKQLAAAAQFVRKTLAAIDIDIDIAIASASAIAISIASAIAIDIDIDLAIASASASVIAIAIDIAIASASAIAISIASAIDIDIDLAIASASVIAIAIDIDIASAIASASAIAIASVKRLEESQSALVERMIECKA